MIFVRASASCAPEWTHLKVVFSDNISLIALAWSWVRNSEHCGGAVFVTRSNKDLQSVAEMASGRFCDFQVGDATAEGSFCKLRVGSCQAMDVSRSQAQNRRSHDNWSNDEVNAMVSAERVLVTTFWIFLQPHEIGLTGHVTFCVISLWVVRMMDPAWESGAFLEANDASENARNLTSWVDTGWMVMDTSWCLFASWRVRLAWINLTNQV